MLQSQLPHRTRPIPFKRCQSPLSTHGPLEALCSIPGLSLDISAGSARIEASLRLDRAHTCAVPF